MVTPSSRFGGATCAGGPAAVGGRLLVARRQHPGRRRWGNGPLARRVAATPTGHVLPWPCSASGRDERSPGAAAPLEVGSAAAGDGGDDGDGLAVGHGRVEPVAEADV